MSTKTTTLLPSCRAWLQAVRPFSFTASMVPVFLGAALVPFLHASARWALLPLVVLASLMVHAATNLVGEYYDYHKGVDRPETYGGSRVLVEQRLAPRQVLIAGVLLFGLTACIGVVFVVVHGWPILLLGLIGIAGGFFYSAMPVGYKYLGLGDVCVFILMGPLMVIGSFFVLTGRWSLQALWISLPVGCLVAAILSANNLRDIKHDTEALIRSSATLLGHRWARWEYSALITGAYGVTTGLAAVHVLPWWSLATWLTIPLGIKNIRMALHSRVDNPEQIATLDVRTAQLHLLFGVLLIGSVPAGAFL